MNKLIFAIFLLFLLSSISYAWYIYLYKKDYSVSFILDDQEYSVKNGDVERCVEESNCPLAE